jgi:hypothetical protein
MIGDYLYAIDDEHAARRARARGVRVERVARVVRVAGRGPRHRARPRVTPNANARRTFVAATREVTRARARSNFK